MKTIFVLLRSFFSSSKDSKEIFLEKLIRSTIYLGIFLIPIFFLPIYNNFTEYLRLLLFIVLVILGLIFGLLKVWLTKKISLVYKFFDLPIIIFTLVYFLASLLAIDRNQSFIGGDNMLAGSFLSILLLVIFYFLASRFINTLKRVRLCLNLLNYSVLLVLLFNIIKIFGLISWLSFFRLSISTFYFLLLIGAVLNIALYLSGKKNPMRYLNLGLSLIFLVVIGLVDEQYLLLTLLLMLFLSILVFSLKSKFFSNKLIIGLTLALFVTVFVLIVPINQFTHLMSPREFNLPLDFGWQITHKAVSDNLLVGVGPQNFAYSFYQYKSTAFNQTSFWQLGFAKDTDFWLGIINDIGLLGFIIILIMIVQYCYRSIQFISGFQIIDQTSRKFFMTTITVLLILAGLIIFGLFYSFDFILIYLLVLFLALGVSLMQPNTTTKEFSQKIVVDLLIYILALLLICFIYFSTRLVVADFLVQKALSLNFSTLDDFKSAESSINKAISLNPNNSIYRSELLDVVVNGASFISKNKIEPEEDLNSKISSIINDILQSKTKVYVVWARLNQDLESLKAAGTSVSEVQKQVNQKLLELNPNNPELYIDRALLNFNDYMLAKDNKIQLTDEAKNVILNKVKKDLVESIRLKNDFVLGYYNLGLYYQEIGDEAGALENIKKAFDLDPAEQIVALSLKKIYINQDDWQAAEETLKKYLESNPQDISTRLELAVVYKDNKQNELAKKELNEVLKLDPNNLTAKQLLSQIK